MIDPASLAASAVALLGPYLAKIPEGAASRIGEAITDAAPKLYAWLRKKLAGAPRDALDELEQSPTDADLQAQLRVQLAKALKQDPTLAEDLAKLLPSTPTTAISQTQTLAEGAKAIQNQGNQSTFTIS